MSTGNADSIAAEDLQRIASPCGLDIGARTPAETPSVLGESIARRSGHGGEPLSSTEGPIHADRSDVPVW